jgi:hypothetical protein
MSLDIDIIGIEDCFRSYIWKPPEGFSDSECQDLIKALDAANKATGQFLRGEIDEDEFIQIKEWAHDGNIDEFLESAEENLDLILPGLL